MGSDDDSTLITDSALIMEDSVDDGVTLVQDRDDATRTLVLDEIGPRGPSYREQLAPRALHNTPPPAASRGVEEPPLAGTVRYPPRVVTAQPVATDPDRRMLPFGDAPRMGSAVGHAPPMGTPQAPPPASQVPQQRPTPAPSGPVVPPPAWQPPARVSAPPPPAAEPVTGPQGTPTFVIRFLAVCGALTGLGLAVLIYLEV